MTNNRASNIELLRIVAMLMVVMVHTCFHTTGTPTPEEVSAQPTTSFFRFLLPSFTIIGVNLFVLISGWFGIKQSKKGFLSLLFQILFYLLLTLPAVLLNNKTDSNNLNGFLSYFLLEGEDWWFVKSYILLYILAPIMNAYTDNAAKKEFRMILIGFFCFMFTWGWLTSGVKWFHDGYSTMAFMGLYMLARYCRLHLTCPVWLGKWHLLGGFIIITFLIAIYSVYTYTFNSIAPKSVLNLYSYNSPFVVASSICLFLFFTKLSFQSYFINRIAKSVFAVYLIHTSKYIFPLFTIKLYDFYQCHPYYLFLTYSIAFSILVFVICIIVDQLRLFLWYKIIEKHLQTKS